MGRNRIKAKDRWKRDVVPAPTRCVGAETEDESIARIFGKHEIPAPVSSFKRTKEGLK